MTYITCDIGHCLVPDRLILVNRKVIEYNAFNVYRRELAPGTVSLTGDRAQGDDSKHWAYFSRQRVYLNIGYD